MSQLGNKQPDNLVNNTHRNLFSSSQHPRKTKTPLRSKRTRVIQIVIDRINPDRSKLKSNLNISFRPVHSNDHTTRGNRGITLVFNYGISVPGVAALHRGIKFQLKFQQLKGPHFDDACALLILSRQNCIHLTFTSKFKFNQICEKLCGFLHCYLNNSYDPSSHHFGT